MPENRSGNLVQDKWQETWRETWRAFYNFGPVGAARFDETPEPMRQLAATVTKWNQELLSFGARRAYEYTKLPERLVNCHSAPDLVKLEMDYLDTMRQHYSEEVSRLLSLGDDVVRLSVTPWSVGNGETIQVREEPAKAKGRAPSPAKESERGDTKKRDDRPASREPYMVE